MIPGLENAALSPLIILAGLVQCPADKTPNIQVHFENTAPQYVHRLSTAELSRMKTDTVFSHHTNEIFTTNGITEGKLQIKFSINYRTLRWPVLKKNCLWVEQADMTLAFSPVVYIASDLKNKPCRRKVITEHELKHVNTDVITLREYAPKFKTLLKSVIDKAGILGPMSDDELDVKKDTLMQKLQQAVDGLSQKLNQTRKQRQQQIDTRREYLRISETCPEER